MLLLWLEDTVAQCVRSVVCPTLEEARFGVILTRTVNRWGAEDGGLAARK